jgi:uncharacterized membrane protein YcaP (DUF421 family)
VFEIDWGRLFLPSISLAELLIRGSVTYLALFTLLRLILHRQTGSLSLTDLLVVTLIADAIQNGMSGEYTSITDGVILVATIMGWDYFLDWLGYRSPRLQRFIHPPPLPLVRSGKLLRQNMRREFITENELMSQLREQGVEDIAMVKLAYLVGDGQISVIKRGGG